jgi:hypothetical protein
MSHPSTGNWKILGPALLITLGAAVWLGLEGEDAAVTTVEAVGSGVATTSAVTSSVSATLPAESRLGRAEITRVPVEIFDHSPPPATPEKQADRRPPKPTVPPLPFIYAGKLRDENGISVFLVNRGKNLVIKAGDKIDNNWLVESITPPIMTFVYVPMNASLTLAIGELN